MKQSFPAWSFLNKPPSMMFYDHWNKKYDWDVELQFASDINEAISIITENGYLCDRHEVQSGIEVIHI